ncbi:hypothetical protein OG930_38685 [Streptomyces sp. NBC_01799]|uniref:hypothetical protein n=1 Tax=Streptomyces sp. NBC_01800 TaxID=2975945 RepID=UPI002DDB62FA|nr:hypothetical protein [Streptomyces sp. NBC_01800]WSA72485.1 hypothetical protein OIE65_39300 [Streptomyces sp. NBC_01800]WSA81010.1 hypothetical protein OG930_38685 [Streptomyces sp. NBC_01799]
MGEALGGGEDGEQPAKWVVLKAAVAVSSAPRRTARRLGRAAWCCGVITMAGSR